MAKIEKGYFSTAFFDSIRNSLRDYYKFKNPDVWGLGDWDHSDMNIEKIKYSSVVNVGVFRKIQERLYSTEWVWCSIVKACFQVYKREEGSLDVCACVCFL